MLATEVIEVMPEDLDGGIKRQIVSIVDVAMRMNGISASISDEDYAKFISETCIDKIRDKVEEYYSFMGELEIKINPEDVRAICGSVVV